MIVKNEEKNIEKALSWAKSVAIEQIVVDTGSTDRTVEIAEQMGAKVFHFEWINDFSAAKNYAIEQASGNWIAFLDADEYFPDEDVKNLMIILRKIENDPVLQKMRSAIRCPIVNLDDDGKPFLILKQDRVFRNHPELRYQGKIHEMLMVPGELLQAPELSIIHTGYTKSAYEDTSKAIRNIDMLRVELSRDPDNVDLMCYLADSLRVTNEEGDMIEAEKLYRDALSSGRISLPQIKQNALNYLITKYFDEEDKAAENFGFCKAAYEEFPANPDFCYYYARKLFMSGEFHAAWSKLVECENILKQESVEMGSYILNNSLVLFFVMTLTAEELDDITETIRCATLALKEDKYQHLMLAPYISAFNRPGYETTADDIMGLLKNLYDFSNTRDKLTVIQAAKKAGNVELVQIVLNTLTQEELKWITES